MPHPVQKMHIHLRMHAYLTLQQLLCHENHENHLESSKLLSALRQTKNIQLNHYDALGEPKIQHIACWFNTPDCHAAPARHCRSTSCVCLLYPFVLPNRWNLQILCQLMTQLHWCTGIIRSSTLVRAPYVYQYSVRALFACNSVCVCVFCSICITARQKN